MFDTTDKDEGFLSNFGMMLPMIPFTEPPEPFFKMWKEYGYWHLKIRIPKYPRLLDRLLRPLCKHGWHRWVGTYGFAQYQYAEYPSTEKGTTRVKQQNFKCARCKKTKTVDVK